MCSTPAQQIAEIGKAIDDLADEAHAAYARVGRPPTIAEADQVLVRLAQVWALLAELDPEVARRLGTYES
jgi:hypothetical protein